MREYTVKTPAGETTVLLSDEDAKARGLKPVAEKKKAATKEAEAPANKARTPAAKRADAVSAAWGKKAEK